MQQLQPFGGGAGAAPNGAGGGGMLLPFPQGKKRGEHRPADKFFIVKRETPVALEGWSRKIIINCSCLLESSKQMHIR